MPICIYYTTIFNCFFACHNKNELLVWSWAGNQRLDRNLPNYHNWNSHKCLFCIRLEKCFIDTNVYASAKTRKSHHTCCILTWLVLAQNQALTSWISRDDKHFPTSSCRSGATLSRSGAVSFTQFSVFCDKLQGWSDSIFDQNSIAFHVCVWQQYIANASIANKKTFQLFAWSLGSGQYFWPLQPLQLPICKTTKHAPS